MDIIDTRQKLDKISASYPEIKEVLDSFLDNVAVQILGSSTPADPIFLKELIDIKGIGKAIAEDISQVYPTREKLVTELKSGRHLPFRKDVIQKLHEKYG